MSQGGEDRGVCENCGQNASDCTCRTVFTVSEDKGSAQIFQTGAHQIGHVVAGRYVIKGVIGVGGMGTVYDARHIVLDNRVALKVLRQELVEEESIMKRFEQEARACAALVHPNLVSVYDCGISEHGEPFLVMQFLEGPLLLDDIKHDGKLSLERFFEVFIQVCTALSYAHGEGVVHRDLKPANIIVTRTPEGARVPVVVDFGIAKIEDLGGNMQMLTQTGEVFGSPAYMSPEQCQGTTIDGRTDIYALGCVMYEALTGRQAFAGHNIMTILEKQLNEMPRSFEELSTGSTDEIPEALAKTVMKCLEKDPDYRYQTVDELKAALLRIKDDLLASHTVKIGSKIFRFESITAILIMVAIALCIFSFFEFVPERFKSGQVALDAESLTQSRLEAELLPELLLAEQASHENIFSHSIPVYLKLEKQLDEEKTSTATRVAVIMKIVGTYVKFKQYHEGGQFYGNNLEYLLKSERGAGTLKKDPLLGSLLALSHYYGGLCYEHRGKYTQAYAALKSATAVAEKFGAPYWLRAKAHIALAAFLKMHFKRPAEAHENAHQAQMLLQSMPPKLLSDRLFELEECYRWQCYTSWDLGKIGRAEREIREAVTISRRRKSAARTRENYENLFRLLIQQGKTEEAAAEKKSMEEFLKRCPPDST
ncbi:MAG: serine/threonine protein kinase [Candidatus Obscuribacterales bacterium]|nr:serine/threonine protein kinase [Candidatus Obscuribacterales bacterium]